VTTQDAETKPHDTVRISLDPGAESAAAQACVLPPAVRNAALRERGDLTVSRTLSTAHGRHRLARTKEEGVFLALGRNLAGE
jgi:hypothetical protein